MMKQAVWVIICVLLMICMAGPGFSQAIGSNPSQVLLETPVPPSVYTVTAQTIGNRGLATYYYWVVANYPIGKAFPGGPAIVTFAPDVLNGSNYVQVRWNGVEGATSYDVLRTSVAGMPNGQGNYAVATAVVGTMVNDQSLTLNPYVVNSVGKASSFLRLDNKNYSQSWIDTLDWRIRNLWLPQLTPSRALVLGSNGQVTTATGVATDCVKVNGTSGVCGGGTIEVQDNGVAVGSRNKVNFIEGGGVLNAITDDGVKINVNQSVNPAVVAYRSGVQSGENLYCVSGGGSGSNFTCTLTPSLSGYTTGMVVNWLPDVNGTGGATDINIDSNGIISITKADGISNPGASDIIAGQLYSIWYDGVRFRLPKESTPTVTTGFIGLGPYGQGYSDVRGSAWCLSVDAAMCGLGASVSGASTSRTTVAFALNGTACTGSADSCTSFAIARFIVPTDFDCTANVNLKFYMYDGSFNNATVTMAAQIGYLPYSAASFAPNTLPALGAKTYSASQTLNTTNFYSATISNVGQGANCEAGAIGMLKLSRSSSSHTSGIEIAGASLFYTKVF